MTAIKHALQRDIFTPNDERLLSIVNVCKAGKKKKNCFLCATGRRVASREIYSVPPSLGSHSHCLYNRENYWADKLILVVFTDC